MTTTANSTSTTRTVSPLPQNNTDVVESQPLGTTSVVAEAPQQATNTFAQDSSSTSPLAGTRPASISRRTDADTEVTTVQGVRPRGTSQGHIVSKEFSPWTSLDNTFLLPDNDQAGFDLNYIVEDPSRLSEAAWTGPNVDPSLPTIIFTNGVAVDHTEARGFVKGLTHGPQGAAVFLNESGNNPLNHAIWQAKLNEEYTPSHREIFDSDGLSGRGIQLNFRRRENVPPSLLDTYDAAKQILNVPTTDVRNATKVLDAHMDAGQPIHIFGHSQGSLIWAKAIQEWKSEEIQSLQAQHPELSEQQITETVEQQLGELVFMESAGNAVKDWPAGPKYLHWINNQDTVTNLVGSKSGERSEGLFVFVETGGHSVSRYMEERNRLLQGMSVEQYREQMIATYD